LETHVKIKSLAGLYRDEFDIDTRRRGERYWASGAVTPTDFQASTLHADVRNSPDLQDTQTWHVEVDVTRVNCTCTCPDFATRGPCEHIWAVIELTDTHDVTFRGADEPDPREASPRKKPPADAAWKRQVDSVLKSVADLELDDRFDREETQRLPEGAKLEYVLDLDYFGDGTQLLIRTQLRKPAKRGEGFLAPKTLCLHPDHLPQLSDVDRPIVLALLGAESQWSYRPDPRDAHTLFAAQQEILLPMMARTGRCFYRKDRKLFPMSFDEGEPWQFTLDIRGNGNVYRLDASLRRGDETRSLSEPVAMLRTGWLIWEDCLSRYDGREHFPWMRHFRGGEPWISVPLSHGPQLVERILGAQRLPKLNVPPELQFEEVAPPCLPGVEITDPRHDRLTVRLVFDYDGLRIPEGRPGAGMFQLSQKRWIRRDGDAEAQASGQLTDLRTRKEYDGTRSIVPARLPALVRELVGLGWRVEAQGKTYRRGGRMSVAVSSGIDWFEVQGKADFGGADASLPDVLAALRKGETFVRLSDGSFGLLPEEWLEQYGLLAKTGQTRGDVVTFKPTQAMLLDAMLAELPEVRVDEAFTRARSRLESHGRVQPADAPEGFVGQLRHYQREGLGWLDFLRHMEFGGCLADDMGLGKTIQVLALLESRRMFRNTGVSRDEGVSPSCPAGVSPASGCDGEGVLTSSSGQEHATPDAGETPASRCVSVGPSLVVVPRSLIFNWRQEAQRFTPRLRVLDHSGTARSETLAYFRNYDLVLTTYGTMRQDIDLLKEVPFDYVILDEAQAIKNAQTASAKASRLLNGRHRLCLSGTPVENHLGELWSQMEFLNPGLLGTWALFGDGKGISDDDRPRLARALRPFILRRTKEQVATELPPCTEQTVYCQLKGPQRELYNELRAHYRTSLRSSIDSVGLAKSKMQILEALLRLRQAACHGGLIDKTQADGPSAKTDALLAQLQEVTAEGHKALVFSQFTSLLALVKPKLDELGLTYEYLDGRTRDRQAKVERFQNDPACPIFLISLKAGGLGLNLTAAGYVFLLDPWWNPAVEAQAIDRAHRIGQTKPVFAYRLIAQDTIEEKVLQLQQSKRDLADSIITADNSVIRDLTRDDLEMLLG